MSLLQIKTIKQHRFSTALLTMAAIVLLSSPVANAATPTTNEIKETIKAKCDVALANEDNKKSSKKADFKLLTEACKGTGAYKTNATKKAQRAQRLLDICAYDNYLREANAYSGIGGINGGDCVKIVSNTELADLTKNLKGYPTGTFGKADDPALNCDPENISNGATRSENCDLMKKYVNPFITLLSGLVAIAVIIGIISGGIRYTTAGDDTQKVAAARAQIRGALVALIAYMFLYAFIQWVLP